MWDNPNSYDAMRLNAGVFIWLTDITLLLKVIDVDPFQTVNVSYYPQLRTVLVAKSSTLSSISALPFEIFVFT
jgi:hypothetical protein